MRVHTKKKRKKDKAKDIERERREGEELQWLTCPWDTHSEQSIDEGKDRHPFIKWPGCPGSRLSFISWACEVIVYSSLLSTCFSSLSLLHTVSLSSLNDDASIHLNLKGKTITRNKPLSSTADELRRNSEKQFHSNLLMEKCAAFFPLFFFLPLLLCKSLSTCTTFEYHSDCTCTACRCTWWMIKVKRKK